MLYNYYGVRKYSIIIQTIEDLSFSENGRRNEDLIWDLKYSW